MSDSWPKGPNPWAVKARHALYQDAWLAIEGNQVVRPDGTEGTYNVVRIRRLGVGILPIDADGRVHMIGQWRFPLGRYSWEMPEGGVEPEENVLSAAKRELAEETGLHAEHWTQILDLDLSTSLTDERAVVFLATGLEQRAAHPEGREIITHRRAHFLEVLERVRRQEIREAATVAAILRAHTMAATSALPSPLAHAMLNAPT